MTDRDTAETVETPASYIAELVEAALEPNEVVDKILLIPPRLTYGGEPVVLDLQRFEDRPRRSKGEVMLEDVPSAIACLTEIGVGHVAFWVRLVRAQPDASLITLVLNGERNGEPGWGDHKVSLTSHFTEAYAAWRSIDGRGLGQRALAEFLEDRVEDVSLDQRATLLELSSTLRLRKTITFRSETSLPNGNRAIEFTEATEGAGAHGIGTAVIPDSFELYLSVFEGMEPGEVAVRLRYRLDGEGNLTFTFSIAKRQEFELATYQDSVVGALDNALDRAQITHVGPMFATVFPDQEPF